MSEHHDLGTEFPEFKDKIHELKLSNAHFKKLFEEYEELNKAVYRSEHRIDLMSNDAEQQLRRDRVHLKDQLFKILEGA